MEGHWQSRDRTLKLHKAKDQEVNSHVVKAFHVSRKSERAMRRQMTERRIVVEGGVRDMLPQIQETKREAEGKGEGKRDIENRLNGEQQEEVLSLDDKTLQREPSAGGSSSSSQQVTSIAGAVTPVIVTPFDAEAVYSSHHSTHIYLKENHGENTLMPAAHEPNIKPILGFPRLSLDFDGNIFSWVQARQVMSTFKIRFRRRIEMVAGIFFIATGGSIVACLSTLYSSADIVAAYETPFVLQTIVVVTVFALALIKYVSEAAKINGMFERHKLSICKHQLRIHAMMAHCQQILTAPEIREQLEHRHNALEACASFIETTNKNEPSEVFGFKAELGLTLSICSGLASFFVTLISIYYYNGGQKPYQ